MDFCEIGDILNRLDFILMNKVHPNYIEFFCLHDETKRKHTIAGWECLTVYSVTGDIVPLLDIWTGFSKEKKSRIKVLFEQACDLRGLRFVG